MAQNRRWYFPIHHLTHTVSPSLTHVPYTRCQWHDEALAGAQEKRYTTRSLAWWEWRRTRLAVEIQPEFQLLRTILIWFNFLHSPPFSDCGSGFSSQNMTLSERGDRIWHCDTMIWRERHEWSDDHSSFRIRNGELLEHTILTLSMYL